MILGNDRPAVVEQIRKNVETGAMNAKAELDDPAVDPAELKHLLASFLQEELNPRTEWKKKTADRIIRNVSSKVNKNTRVIGIEKLQNLHSGSVVTCNHFNQVDNTVVRYALAKHSSHPVHTVIEETNLAMGGLFGFLMKYARNIPLADDFDYLRGPFIELMQKAVDDHDYVLIYPEQEMWFNYRRPRPLKRGAYYYASKLKVPVISLFVEMQDLDGMDDKNFHHVQYIVHVLDPIYPDPSKTDRQNSIEMLKKDYEQRRIAYETIYNKPIDAPFDYSDIAGFVKETIETS